MSSSPERELDLSYTHGPYVCSSDDDPIPGMNGRLISFKAPSVHMARYEDFLSGLSNEERQQKFTDMCKLFKEHA